MALTDLNDSMIDPRERTHPLRIPAPSRERRWDDLLREVERMEGNRGTDWWDCRPLDRLRYSDVAGLVPCSMRGRVERLLACVAEAEALEDD